MRICEYTQERRRTKCSVPGCGKRFKENAALFKHVKSHSPSRPYQCNMCGTAFKLKHHLKRHKEKVHEIPADAPSAFPHPAQYPGHPAHYHQYQHMPRHDAPMYAGAAAQGRMYPVHARPTMYPHMGGQPQMMMRPPGEYAYEQYQPMQGQYPAQHPGFQAMAQPGGYPVNYAARPMGVTGPFSAGHGMVSGYDHRPPSASMQSFDGAASWNSSAGSGAQAWSNYGPPSSGAPAAHGAPASAGPAPVPYGGGSFDEQQQNSVRSSAVSNLSSRGSEAEQAAAFTISNLGNPNVARVAS
eukprot:Opistho-2@49242